MIWAHCYPVHFVRLSGRASCRDQEARREQNSRPGLGEGDCSIAGRWEECLGDGIACLWEERMAAVLAGRTSRSPRAGRSLHAMTSRRKTKAGSSSDQDGQEPGGRGEEEMDVERGTEVRRRSTAGATGLHMMVSSAAQRCLRLTRPMHHQLELPRAHICPLSIVHEGRSRIYIQPSTLR